jgi:hypothetical protein
MEWWSDGETNTPVLQHSITPSTPTLHYSILFRASERDILSSYAAGGPFFFSPRTTGKEASF